MREHAPLLSAKAAHKRWQTWQADGWRLASAASLESPRTLLVSETHTLLRDRRRLTARALRACLSAKLLDRSVRRLGSDASTLKIPDGSGIVCVPPLMCATLQREAASGPTIDNSHRVRGASSCKRSQRVLQTVRTGECVACIYCHSLGPESYHPDSYTSLLRLDLRVGLDELHSRVLLERRDVIRRDLGAEALHVVRCIVCRPSEWVAVVAKSRCGWHGRKRANEEDKG